MRVVGKEEYGGQHSSMPPPVHRPRPIWMPLVGGGGGFLEKGDFLIFLLYDEVIKL